jgi:hypothetical protein
MAGDRRSGNYMKLSSNDDPRPKLSPAAERALAEAQARRVQASNQATQNKTENPPRVRPDPTRYGDWEVKGLASDF